MIEVKNITKVFGKTIAVDQVSFTIEEGEIFGIIGENGAGKTTLLRMLATMLTPSSGTAVLGEYDILGNPQKVRENLGILFGGESGLYDRLTVAENIRYFGELNGVSIPEIKKRTQIFAKTFEMEDFINKRAGKLSKGMRQKAAFARAIIHNPKYLLLDEPTSGLDVSVMRDVQDFLFQQKKFGKTIIFSSHTMSEVGKLCDHIAVIHKGKLMMVGTLENYKEKYQTENLENVFLQIVGGHA